MLKGLFNSIGRGITRFFTMVPFLVLIATHKGFKDALNRLTWSRKQMEVFEFERFKEVISYAYEHSPFYKELYDSTGVSVDDIKTHKDIERLPIVTKSLLREALAQGTIFTASKPPKGTAKTSTTGSTGVPMMLYFDFPSRKHRYINGMRSLWIMGSFPYKRFTLFWRKKKKSKRQQLRSLLGVYQQLPVVDVVSARHDSLGKNELTTWVAKVEAFNPEIIRGYTSALWVLAQLKEKKNLSINPEHVITSAEYLPPLWWDEMERIFNCPVHNFYGGTEASPIATSRAGSRDLMIFSDFYGVEVVTNQGQKTKEGEVGRILVTDYYSRYMPLIRYEIGDMAEWSTATSGPFPAFRAVHGRVNDIFILPGNRLLFSHNWHIYFRGVRSISRFRVIQKELTHIAIALEVQDTTWNDELKALREKIESAFTDITITWELVEEIALDKGEKFRAVKSELTTEDILKHI